MKQPILHAVLLSLLTAGAGRSAEPAATVGDHVISLEAVEEQVRSRLIKMDHQRYEVLRGGLDQLLGELLIEMAARVRDMTPEEYAAAEIDARTPRPDSAMVEKVYESNKKKMSGLSPVAARAEVERWVLEQALAKRRKQVVAELAAEFGTRINLLPPAVEVDTGGRPSLGGDVAAPVTLEEFSDYECPYCKRTEPVIRQILEIYGDQVRFVYRDFPLKMHRNARPASLAARCAEDQDAFWLYHERLMESSKLNEEVYRRIADGLSLDRAAFDDCLAAESFTAAIDRDIADGKSAGVSSTPVFFVNGRRISGAKPLATFRELIDAELSRKAGG